ncbi:MAG: tetratricopeptide repeat protein [candidate division KSB1 bacterium]|nr:tetratricopeptide repeat protein [candidate division KSB1 bacterium]MDZ7356733.1 tetratricopeptide repeat protein [candidate division KSB1 bacterium]MDZ7398643.1 tetratricopeptide repeat protein [candidate division KSB1 bacterium]
MMKWNDVMALQGNKAPQNRAIDNKATETDHEVIRAANQILRGSIELYNEKAYWKSARELIILMDYYPEFERLDEVIYYLAQCLFEEDLSTSAIRMFKHLVKKFPKSPLVPAALLGLEKTYYNQKNYKMALSIYFAILKQTTPERELLNEARYYAGLSHFNMQNYDLAIDVLKKIDDRSNFYDNALYTTALSYLKKSNVATAVDFFRKIVSLPITNGERRDVVDNARLTLGYIYYELKSYNAAIKLLNDISEKHQYYQDALLALGWCYLKLEDHQNVIKYLKKLIKQFPDSENAEEAYFLLGQSYIALNDYDNAIQSYQTIVDIYQDKVQLPNLISKVNTSLEQEQDRVEKLKVKVLVEETKLLDAISLDGYGKELPKHVLAEKKKLKEYRERLISSLITERDNLLYLQETIYNLKQLAERRERRKDWKGYAEYGISRALFLKNMQTVRGN